MTRAARRAARSASAVILLVVACAGCGASSPPVRPPVDALMAQAASRASVVQAPPAAVGPHRRVTKRRGGPMRGLVATARRRWGEEQYGTAVHGLLARVAADPIMARALRSGDLHRIQTAVTLRFRPVWYHWHVSRLRVVRGGRTIVDVGVPFVVAASRLRIPGAHGLWLEISDQDVIGFVRFMRRNHRVDIVARGQTAAHVRSSLPAALRVRLPHRGTVRIAGRRYRVGFLVRHALGGERVRLWVLARR